MFRGLVLAIVFLVSLRADALQALGVLHIKVVVVNGQQQATPVPRHVLLISDNPSSAPPRRTLTSNDGTVDVRLPPGNYTVESDRPLAFEGKAYQWTQMVDVVAGREAVLELTGDNAEVEAITAATASTAAPLLAADPASLVARWQDSVAGIWTPTTHASAFLVDANGLMVTNQRVIGLATSVEVQLAPDVKVAASILVADQMRDVAVLRIDPAIAASVQPVPLGCGPALPPLVNGDEVFVIEAPLGRQKDTTAGTVRRELTNIVVSGFTPSAGGAGGPVFTAGGSVAGIISVTEDRESPRGGTARVVRIGDVCDVVALAATKMKDAKSPSATRLPVEPVHAFPVDALRNAAERPAASLSPYVMSSSDFDLALLTPLQVYAAQSRPMDFGNWSEYVADLPPVLLVRATPKFAEGFWTKVARGAAQTQGIALPPSKRPKTGFSRMRAFCGETEITPIHPLKIERRVSASDAINEGLYAFDPGALQPSCGSVKLVLYSEKEPEKPDTIVVDAKVVQQIWQDFAPHRAVR